MEDDLTWLARNAHQWPAGDTLIGRIMKDGEFAVVSVAGAPVAFVNWFTLDQWLARRAELQNKPSWKDAPEWACYLGQSDEGAWHWFDGEPEINEVHDFGEFWKAPGYTAITDRHGAVLGDWRDTLERRPAATPEPVVTKMMDEAIIDKFMGYVRAMPVSLSTVLSSEDLADLHQLCDDELTKRDAAVCGGQKHLDVHWFERGELPPVGTECEFCGGAGDADDPWHPDLMDGDRVTVIAHFECGICTLAAFTFKSRNPNIATVLVEQANYGCFRPIRTERDKAIDEMKQHCPHHGSWDAVGRIYAEALYDAGYRKQNLTAN
ncbi:hypothetical protein [Aeromonas enteropelogenes]|uniref:hypothetical protein n=1 Tax=Aeromonas enteropelogenes TaxID=29489 RepID=UPI003BA0EFC5